MLRQPSTTPTSQISYKPFDVETDVSIDHDESQSLRTFVCCGSVQLNPGITPSNFYNSILFRCQAGCLMTAIAYFERGFNSREVNNGKSSGFDLMLIFQILIFILAVPYGHLADRFGRRKMIIFGAICYAFSAILIFLFRGTKNFTLRVIIKVFMSSGRLAFTVVPLLADYVANNSRGRASAIVFNAKSLWTMAASFLFVRVLSSLTQDQGHAGLIFSLVTCLLIILTAFGIKEGYYYSPQRVESQQEGWISFSKNVKEALVVYRNNSWLAISLILRVFGGSVTGIFFIFLTKNIEYLRKPYSSLGEILFTEGWFDYLGAFLEFFSYLAFGWYLDKKNKTITALSISLIGGLIGFLILTQSMTFLSEILLIFGVGVVDVTWSGAEVARSYIAIKHYPADKRGIMSGIPYCLESIGLILAKSGSSYAFSNWGESTPFGICAALLLICSVLVVGIYKKNIQGKE